MRVYPVHKTGAMQQALVTAVAGAEGREGGLWKSFYSPFVSPEDDRHAGNPRYPPSPGDQGPGQDRPEQMLAEGDKSGRSWLGSGACLFQHVLEQGQPVSEMGNIHGQGGVVRGQLSTINYNFCSIRLESPTCEFFQSIFKNSESIMAHKYIEI